MARRPLDHTLLEGEQSRHNIDLDARCFDILLHLGCGQLALGARVAARMAHELATTKGTLSRDYLETRAETNPAEVAAYYAAHPEQADAPYVSPYASKAGRRAVFKKRGSNHHTAPAGSRNPVPAGWVEAPPPFGGSLEELRARDEAYRARLAAEQAQGSTTVPGFEGWDD